MNYAQDGKLQINMAGGIGAACKAPTDVPRMSEVSMQITALNSNLDRLDDSIQILQARLNPILAIPNPCESIDGNKQQAMQTDLAKLLQMYNNRFECLLVSIKDIAQRIEL